jgi:hypothetical protein
MDWKFKHFSGAQTYRQPPGQVLAEARGLMTQTARWRLEDTADGFRAQAVGNDFGHDAAATFHVAPDGDGSKVTVEMAVRRVGLEGYMLFDIGGYYSGEIRGWLDGLTDRLDGRPADAAHRPRSAGARAFGCLAGFIVVVGGFFLLWSLVIAPTIGLAFGVLYLPGRGSGGITLHGPWARGVSAALIALDVLIYLRWRTWSRRRS